MKRIDESFAKRRSRRSRSISSQGKSSVAPPRDFSMSNVYRIENLEDLLQCSICLDRYQTPKVLSCQHTFCLRCLQGNCLIWRSYVWSVFGCLGTFNIANRTLTWWDEWIWSGGVFWIDLSVSFPIVRPAEEWCHWSGDLMNCPAICSWSIWWMCSQWKPNVPAVTWWKHWQSVNIVIVQSVKIATTSISKRFEIQRRTHWVN